jgi:hypothetical protein
MIERLRQWPADTLARLGRTAAGPATVRVLAGLSAFLAMLVSLPADVSLGGRPWLPLATAAGLAACVALYPRGRWAGAVALVSVGAWVVASVGYGDKASLPRVGAVGGLLYAMHAAAAFAAVLPYDCVVSPMVLTRWLMRQARLLAAGLTVGLGGLWLVRFVSPTPTIAGPVLGALAAAALAGVLAWQLHGRLGARRAPETQ